MYITSGIFGGSGDSPLPGGRSAEPDWTVSAAFDMETADASHGEGFLPKLHVPNAGLGKPGRLYQR
jgi:hypothetical protein